MPEPFERILVIKLRYIGDVLLTTPVLRNIRLRFPRAHVAMVVNAGTDVILRHNRCVDEVLVLHREQLKSRNPVARLKAALRYLQWARARGFDCVVDLTDADRSALLACASGARTRVGFNAEGRWRGRLYTHLAPPRQPGQHTVDYQLGALRALGLEICSRELELPLAPGEEEAAAAWLARQGVREGVPFVACHPGARWWFRQWPAEKFAALADRLQAVDGLPVVFLGGTQEMGFLAAVRPHMQTPFRGGAGELDLLEVAAVLRRARVLVGNESAPQHLAAAMGTLVVALFGRSDPAEWGPWGPEHRAIRKVTDCSACIHPTCVRGEQNCLRVITVEEVAEAVRAQLGRAAALSAR